MMSLEVVKITLIITMYYSVTLAFCFFHVTCLLYLVCICCQNAFEMNCFGPIGSFLWTRLAKQIMNFSQISVWLLQVYGMLMARSTYEGMKLANENKRPFVLTRAGFIGSQRYAATWTGDNLSNWEHLHMSISMVLQLVSN